jgi:hypothetical protein
MAMLLYKGNLITVACTRKKDQRLWESTVDIRWSYDSGTGFRLHSKKSFKSNEEAENYGFRMGKAWIDLHPH